MSDIHVLRVTERPNGLILVQTVYHVPVPAALQPPGSASGLYPVDPSRESVVLVTTTPTELADLQAGTLIEVVETWRDNVQARTKVQVRDAIRANWSVVAARTATELLEQYAFYGTELGRL